MGSGCIKLSLDSSLQTSSSTPKNDEPLKKNTKNKKQILAFYSTFKFYLNKYELDGIRKYRIDCLIKRAKSKFIKSLHYAMNYCLNLNVKRLPQSFVLNIKIDYNKKYLDKTIEEIYTQFEILPSLSEILEKKLIHKGKEEVFKLLMKGTFHYVYHIYLMSRLYQRHKNQVTRKNGIGVGVLYDYIANNLCNYYIFSEVTQFKRGENKKIKKIFETKKK